MEKTACTKAMLILCLGAASFLSPAARAVTDENQTQTGVVDRQMRLGLAIATSEKLSFRLPSGAAQVQWAYRDIMRKTLRAKIAQDNHFYFKKWHIHTTPDQGLKAGGRSGEIKISIYQRPGDGSVEELLTTVNVQGNLSGNGSILNFNGHNYSRIETKSMLQAYDVVVGSPKAAKEWSQKVATKQSTQLAR